MPDMDVGKRMILFLFLLLESLLILIALWPTVAFLQWTLVASEHPLARALTITAAILLFNYAYLFALLVLRLLIPKPAEGYYPHSADGRPPREALLLMLNLLLVKARFHTPWSAMFTSVLANIFPLNRWYRRLFGPDTPSVTLGDTCVFTDPYLLKAGRNVQFGLNCVIICHVFDHRGLLVKRVQIGDHAVVGGMSLIMPGVVIGHNAVVGARSLVISNTVIKPYELWAGTPARKIRDLSPEHPFSEEENWNAGEARR